MIGLVSMIRWCKGSNYGRIVQVALVGWQQENEGDKMRVVLLGFNRGVVTIELDVVEFDGA